MPRTHSCAATPSMERFHAYRYRQVFQFHQGVRLHPTRRQIQGRVRARFGGRTRRTRQLERAPEDLVRARARAKRQDFRSRSESRLIPRLGGGVYRLRVQEDPEPEGIDMTKEALIEMEGVVNEVLPDTRYRVTLEHGHMVIASVAA